MFFIFSYHLLINLLEATYMLIDFIVMVAKYTFL